jgi:MerR family transcriptional regulator/heat shock protein HspR
LSNCILAEDNEETLRNWETAGLIRPSRPLGNRRVYSEAELELLRYIRRLQQE